MELGKGEPACDAAGSPLSTQASRGGQGEEGKNVELGSHSSHPAFHIPAPSVKRSVKTSCLCTIVCAKTDAKVALSI